MNGRRAGSAPRAEGAAAVPEVPPACSAPSLVLFTRVPVPGRAKTRLLPVLSGEQCAALQRAMACDAAAALGSLGLPVTVRYSDETCGLEGGAALRGAFLGALRSAALAASAPSVRCMPQEGAGLGERMEGALADELAADRGACLLMGSDLPAVDAAALRAALSAFGIGGGVDGGNPADVLLGPSDDGGYWLVGLRAAFPELFAGKRYGTGSVLDEALAACQACGRTVVLGPVAGDVDTPDDLERLADLVDRGDRRVGPRTSTWVRAWRAGRGNAV